MSHNEIPILPAPLADGYAGNLTPDQTQKLRDFWAGYFEWVAKAHGGSTHAASSASPMDIDNPKAAPKGDAAKDEARIQEEQANLNALLDSYGPDSLKRALWEFIKMDNPDSICLRFLRARKWDVTRALGMFAGCLKWRLDNGVQDLVEDGELVSGAKIEKFLDQQRSGKTYSLGAAGGPGVAPIPICYIHVKKHFTNGQPSSSMEKYVIYAMETFRCLMQPPGDKAIMFFDLGGFGVKNMDWHCILFIVKCLEAYYPESLSVLYVHNAPWVFSGIWKVLSPMLDPVVRSKIQFTKTAKDVQANVPADHMIASLGGNNVNEFNFIEPQPGENDKQKDTTVKPHLLQRYHDLADAYEAATKRWIDTNGTEYVFRIVSVFVYFSVLQPTGLTIPSQILLSYFVVCCIIHSPSVEEERNLLFKKLRVAQFDLEPYTRGVTAYHRNGVLDGQGVTRWTYTVDGQNKFHVIGRIMCAATLRREIYEMEVNGKTSTQVEAESEAADKRRDWVALYGDYRLAAQVEGESEVRNQRGVLSGVQFDFTAPPGQNSSQPQAQRPPPQSDHRAGDNPDVRQSAGLAGIGAAAAYGGLDDNTAYANDTMDGQGEPDHDAAAHPEQRRWQPGKYKSVELGGPSAKEVESRAFDLPEGTAKTLTPDQQVKLREMWSVYFSWLDKAHGNQQAGMHKHKHMVDPASEPDPKKANSDADKEAQRIAEEQAQLDELLNTYGGDVLKKAAWQFLDFDDPDGALLRFLRARKWDVNRAMNMCGATLNWRMENDVESLVAAGDLGNGKAIPKFLDQQRENKTFACGTALNEQPICAILVKKHFTNGQPATSMEKFVIFAMESFRLLMQPPQEKVVIIFSLEGFGIKNMDWNCVLFIVKCLEAFYPESLGCIYLYAAPWIFSGIWKVLSPLLDPVVRSKIVFVKTAKDFADRIPPERLIEEVGGKAVDSFKFIEPVEGENDIQLNTSEKEKYIGAYMKLADEFEDATRRWVMSNGQDSDAIRDRALLKRKLRVASFDKMPYVRGKTVYHRQGTVDGMGRVTWVYKTKDGQLYRHVIGRRDHYATMLREINEIESGMPVADVEAKTEAAIARRDWLALYGDPYAAHEIEGVPLDRAALASQPTAPATAAAPAHKRKHRAGKHHHHGHNQAPNGDSNIPAMASLAVSGAAAGGGGYAAAQAYASHGAHDSTQSAGWANRDMDARSGSSSSPRRQFSEGTAPTEPALTDRSVSPPQRDVAKLQQAQSAHAMRSEPALPAGGGLSRYGTHGAEDGYTSSEDMFFDTTEARTDELARARAYVPPGHSSTTAGQEKSAKRSHRDRRHRRASSRGPGAFNDDAAAAVPYDSAPMRRIPSGDIRISGRRSGGGRSTGGRSTDGRSGGGRSTGGRSGGGRSVGGRSGGGRSIGGRSGDDGRSVADAEAETQYAAAYGGRTGTSQRNSVPNGGYGGLNGYDLYGRRRSYRSYTGAMRVTGGLASTPGSAVHLYGGSFHYGPGDYGRGSEQQSDDVALLYPETQPQSLRSRKSGTLRRAASSLMQRSNSRASLSTPALGGYDEFGSVPEPTRQRKPSLRRRLSSAFRA